MVRYIQTAGARGKIAGLWRDLWRLSLTYVTDRDIITRHGGGNRLFVRPT